MITLTYIVLTIIFLLTGVEQASAEPLKIVSYNVENLFHPAHDSLKDDYEWTPEGERHWSYTRYYKKEENLARVLTNIGQWKGVDIVGMQEVENAQCVKHLCSQLRKGEYDFVHYESPDPRGIDVALLYKKARVDTLSTQVFPIPRLTTRDILYVKVLVDKKDTLHLFVCHFPSQRGGKAESEWKRQAAREVLQQALDSIFAGYPDAKIAVMGDMNDDRLVLNGLTDKKIQGNGTHKYQGRWIFLDHFYLSHTMESLSHAEIYEPEWIQEADEKYLGLKPKRTYNGFHYQNGFSDHLPIVLNVNLPQ